MQPKINPINRLNWAHEVPVVCQHYNAITNSQEISILPGSACGCYCQLIGAVHPLLALFVI